MERLRKGGALRVLAIGSSTTAGVGASSPAAAYPAQLKHEIERRHAGVTVSMAASGIGGETAMEAMFRLQTEIDRWQPDLVVWQVGTNDALADVAENDFRAVIERGVGAAGMAGADLVLVDPQFFPAIDRPERYERFVAIVAEVGQRNKVAVLGRYALMKAWAAQSDAMLRAMLAADAFHMSDRGHACLARALGDEIVNAAMR